jgi:hypothetical protein
MTLLCRHTYNSSSCEHTCIRRLKKPKYQTRDVLLLFVLSYAKATQCHADSKQDPARFSKYLSPKINRDRGRVHYYVSGEYSKVSEISKHITDNHEGDAKVQYSWEVLVRVFHLT